MRKFLALLSALFLLLSLTACGGREAAPPADPAETAAESVPEAAAETETAPEPETEPETEPDAEKEPQAEPEPEDPLIEQLGEQLRKSWDARVFSDEADLSKHPGLLRGADVTGPFLEIYRKNGERCITDDTEDRPDPRFPADAVIRETADIPAEYLSLLHPAEKRAAAEAEGRPLVYALLEYTGYGSAGDYRSFILYYHHTRVSFYRSDTGELVGWMYTDDSRSGPFLLHSDEYDTDGQHLILLFDNGTIWADDVWTKALDELFYDENGYQVVGDRLLSVPEEADPIRVPDGVRVIEARAGRRSRATGLILPEGVERIGYSAFYNTPLETVEFPSSLRFTDALAFADTPWWESRETEDWVIVGDGVLLWGRAEGEEITLPETAKYVMPESLDLLSCRTLIIPETVLQLCGSRYGSPRNHDGDVELEAVIFRGGLRDVLGFEGVSVDTLFYTGGLRTVTVDCETDELDDGWLTLDPDTLDQLTIRCAPDSPAAVWAAANGVKTEPLS